jgi:dipeptidyl aminopeptidase/acylaminoacyl peptidase
MTFIADIGLWFDGNEMGIPLNDSLFDHFDTMWKHSPLKYMKGAKTPTLFIHSDQDCRCPLPEGMQMMQSLAYQDVETRLVIFHGEHHGLSRVGKPLHRIRRLEEIAGWFDKHIN